MIVTDDRLQDPVLLGWLHLLYHIRCKWLYSPSRPYGCVFCGLLTRTEPMRTEGPT
jgi:hypothetical protein